MKRILVILSVFLLFFPAVLPAQTGGSSTVEEIDSVIVRTRRRTDGIKGNPNLGFEVSVESLDKFPKLLGTSDPFKYIRSTAGVTISTDTSSELIVQGCDNGQTFTRLCGVPVFGHGHILGLFSVFITDHFEKMTFSKDSPYENIGGIVSMDTGHTLKNKFSGKANIGPVSAHFSLNIPIFSKSALSVSARRSFVDVFYKNLLSIDGINLDYHFYDVNAAYFLKLDDSNVIDANFYAGNDKTGDNAIIKGYDMSSNWGDMLGNVRWRHESDNLKLSVQGYGSRYRSRFAFKNETSTRYLDSEILDFGIEACADVGRSWKSRLSLDYYSDSSFLGSANIGWDGNFDGLILSAGVKPALFRSPDNGKIMWSIDPKLSLGYNLHRGGKFALSFGTDHQYLILSGPPNEGLPFEFWLTAGRYSDPQYSHSANLAYDLDFSGGMYHFSFNAYFKRLWNQLEYTASIADIAGSSYDPGNAINVCDGRNYGINATLQKTGRNLTGWICYNWGRAFRCADGSEWFSSSHERIHEFNAVASYRYKRFDFGTNLVFASGQPYTPATTAFVVNESILVEYGKTNSNRLPPYFRWDISVSFNIRTEGRFRDGINISVQNLTASHNPFLATLKVRDGQYAFAPVNMIIPIIPSINYYCSF